MPQPDVDLDALEAQYNASRAGAVPEGLSQPDDDEPPVDDEPIVDDGDPGEPDDDQPPGFKSYDEYIADGGDPDMYRGKKAYAAEKQRIDENKELRNDVKGLKQTVQQVVDSTELVLTQSEERIRTELEQELLAARENEDVDGAIEAQRKIDKVESKAEERQSKQQQTPSKEVGLIAEFRRTNPLIDTESAQFNKEFNDDVESLYNATAEKLSLGWRKVLTDGQIKRALAAAVKEAKTLHADLFESPRNNQQRGAPSQRQQRRATREEPVASADNYVIDNPRNPRQKNAASEIRDTIRATAIKNAQKRGLSEAEQKKAGDKAAADFEKSLTR